jgi:hypothetical protein
MRTIPALVLLIAVISLSVPAVYASSSPATVHLKIMTYSDPGLTTPASRVREGGTLYLVVSLRTQSGKPVVWNSPVALQITLYVRTGVLSATNVFITAGNSNTSSSFGLILYLAPSAPGFVHIKASAVLSGVTQTAAKRILVLP